ARVTTASRLMATARNWARRGRKRRASEKSATTRRQSKTTQAQRTHDAGNQAALDSVSATVQGTSSAANTTTANPGEPRAVSRPKRTKLALATPPRIVNAPRASESARTPEPPGGHA